MSKEWAHDAVRKEVPTVNVTPVGFAVASSARAVLAVAGTHPRLRGEVCAQLVQDGSGFPTARTAMPSEVVVARPRMQQQKKNPFTTHGAVIDGAKSGPHRDWDPV